MTTLLLNNIPICNLIYLQFLELLAQHIYITSNFWAKVHVDTTMYHNTGRLGKPIIFLELCYEPTRPSSAQTPLHWTRVGLEHVSRVLSK